MGNDPRMRIQDVARQRHCRATGQRTDWTLASAVHADVLVVIATCRMSESEKVDERFIDTDALDSATVERLFPVAYQRLRQMAHQYLKREATGHTLTTTDLVHQAYLELSDGSPAPWRSHSQFMGIAAVAMRRILVDHARSRGSIKRGGGLRRVDFESVDLASEDRADLLLALDEALDRLRELDERQVRVVECRFFAGLTEEETAATLGVTARTVTRDWAKARSWLYREIFKDV